VHASKILQTVSPFFRVKPPVGAVFEIFWVKRKVQFAATRFNAAVGVGKVWRSDGVWL
jgi:hypothetical protein